MSKRIELDPQPSPRRRRVESDALRRRAPERRRVSDRIAVGIAGLLVLFGLFTGFVAYTMVRARTFDPMRGVATYFIPAPAALFHKERIFVLLMGLDYDYDQKDMPTSKDARTDKIEAFALDFPSGVIKSVAIPRDLDAVVRGHEDKINDAFHYGGWRGTDAAVGPLLSMPQNGDGYFDRYVVLRINASKDIINAIGGLDVPVEQAMDYDDNWGHLHIHFKPGIVHMDGDQAVSYARFRHDACSDPCRIRRQQQIEKLAIDKLKHDRFNDLTHIGALIDVVRRDVDTNLSPDEMRSLAWHFHDLNIADVHTTQIPFRTDKVLACCGDVLVADADGVQKLVADFLGPYQAQAPPATAQDIAAVKPSTISIAVLNGSGIAGLGKRAADQLRRDGYVVASVGNADTFDYQTSQIRAHSPIPLAGERLRSDLGLAGVTIAPDPESSPPSDLTLVVGRDYALALPSPAPAAAPKP